MTDVELGDVGDSPVCGRLRWTYICHARPILSLISGGYQGDIRKYYRDIRGYRSLIWPLATGTWAEVTDEDSKYFHLNLQDQDFDNSIGSEGV